MGQSFRIQVRTFKLEAAGQDQFFGANSIVRSCLSARELRHQSPASKNAMNSMNPINSIAQAFADPQVHSRGMRIDLPHPGAGQVPLVASPIKMSATPPVFERAPPLLGQHTDEILREELGLDAARIAALREASVVA